MTKVAEVTFPRSWKLRIVGFKKGEKVPRNNVENDRCSIETRSNNRKMVILRNPAYEVQIVLCIDVQC